MNNIQQIVDIDNGNDNNDNDDGGGDGDGDSGDAMTQFFFVDHSLIKFISSFEMNLLFLKRNTNNIIWNEFQ